MSAALLLVLVGALIWASPAAATQSFNATEGQQFSGTVGTFTEGCHYNSVDQTYDCSVLNPSATINWGDGSSGTATVAETSCGPPSLGAAPVCNFSVSGTHTYSEEGSDSASFTWSDKPYSTGGTVPVTANVGDATLSDEPRTYVVTAEGQALVDQGVANFVDPANGPASDFSSTIDWGDGSQSTGTVTELSRCQPQCSPWPGHFEVTGGHTYAEEGSYTVTTTTTDDGGAQTVAHESVTVSDGSLSASAAGPISGVEGQAVGSIGNVQLATFTDSGRGPASDFTATIDWGDGSKTDTSGTIGTASGGGFTVSGNHTYAEEGSYAVTVTITDDGGAQTVAQSTVNVGDGQISASPDVTVVNGGQVVGFPATEGQALSNEPVATFSDSGGGPASDFTATIDWGDGATSSGAINPLQGQGAPVSGAQTSVRYGVDGTHMYADEGSYTVTVTITDDGGQTQQVTEPARVGQQALTVSPIAVQATAGTAFQGPVANFTDPTPGTTPAEYMATIDWGDGSTANGTVTAAPGGGFQVVGSHTYSRPGSYVTTAVVDDGPDQYSGQGAAQVAAAGTGTPNGTGTGTANGTGTGPTQTTTGPTQTTTSLSLQGDPAVEAQELGFTLVCQAATGHVCHGYGQLTTTEKLRGQRLIAISARQRRSRSKRVVVGQVSYLLSAGQRKTIRLSLNALGRRLLARFGKVPVTMTINLFGASGKTTTVGTYRFVFKLTKHHRKRH